MAAPPFLAPLEAAAAVVVVAVVDFDDGEEEVIWLLLRLFDFFLLLLRQVPDAVGELGPENGDEEDDDDDDVDDELELAGICEPISVLCSDWPPINKSAQMLEVEELEAELENDSDETPEDDELEDSVGDTWPDWASFPATANERFVSTDWCCLPRLLFVVLPPSAEARERPDLIGPTMELASPPV